MCTCWPIRLYPSIIKHNGKRQEERQRMDPDALLGWWMLLHQSSAASEIL
jgi:hypothetical protein